MKKIQINKTNISISVILLVSINVILLLKVHEYFVGVREIQKCPENSPNLQGTIMVNQVGWPHSQ